MQRLARLARSRSDRRDEGAYVVEGRKLLDEALAAGVALEAVYVEDGAELGDLRQQAGAAAVEVLTVAAGGLRRIVDTVSPQPVAAIAALPRPSMAGAEAADLVLVLVGVGDPGNVGTLLRTAEAAGAGAVVAAEGTADPFGPKSVRASAGAVFRLPVLTEMGTADALRTLGRAGHRRLATVASGGVPYDGVDLRGPLAVVLGSEAHGLPPELDPDHGDLCDLAITIPMDARRESLNVAMAGTVVCFEARRQRRLVP